MGHATCGWVLSTHCHFTVRTYLLALLFSSKLNPVRQTLHACGTSTTSNKTWFSCILCSSFCKCLFLLFVPVVCFCCFFLLHQAVHAIWNACCLLFYCKLQLIETWIVPCVAQHEEMSRSDAVHTELRTFNSFCYSFPLNKKHAYPGRLQQTASISNLDFSLHWGVRPLMWNLLIFLIQNSDWQWKIDTHQKSKGKLTRKQTFLQIQLHIKTICCQAVDVDLWDALQKKEEGQGNSEPSVIIHDWSS